MHPSTLPRLAQDRRREFEGAAARASALSAARRVGAGGATPRRARATRYLGEVLIRTGWRLVGPDSPATGVRGRIALRGPGGAAVGPC
jgi:hypothetical protein